jgi:CheY-specific phosphatase CheX
MATSPLVNSLAEAATLVFNDLAFLYTDRRLTDEQREAPVAAAVRVPFRGAFQGSLVVRLCGNVLPDVAANVLGVEAPPPQQLQEDALAELANVILGNLLPAVAGPRALFQLGAPQILEDCAVPEPGAAETLIQAQLGLDRGRADLFLFLPRDAAPPEERRG